MNPSDHEHTRRFWVVSPAVDGGKKPVEEWKEASIHWHAAFMGYSPSDTEHKGIGPRFAKEIRVGDVILIARRYHGEPDVVGFGVVRDNKHKPPNVNFKTQNRPDAWRVLKPFVALNGTPPISVPFLGALKHTMALARLHPANDDHRRVCEWMWNRLSKKSTGASMGLAWVKRDRTHDKAGQSADESPFQGNQQLDYKYWTRNQRKHAMRREQRLIEGYENWIVRKGDDYELVTYKFRLCSTICG